MSYYNVYLAEYLSVPINHQSIFVEMQADGSGQLYHVIGSIQDGMQYESRLSKAPSDSNTYISQTLIGWVYASDYPQIHSICAQNPPPKKQFQGGKKIYPREPLRRCQEWAAESISMLVNNGVVHQGQPPSDGWIWSEENQQYYRLAPDGSIEWAT